MKALSLLDPLGRLLLSAIFLSAAGNKLLQFTEVVNDMASAGVPQPKLMLIGAIIFLIVGSISVIFGFKARVGATFLLVFLGLATYYFHAFWNLAGDSPERTTEMVAFMKNLALMGAMLILIARGSGPYSIDSRKPAKKPS